MSLIREAIVTVGDSRAYGVNAGKVIDAATALFEQVDPGMAVSLKDGKNNLNANTEVQAYLRALRVDNPDAVMATIRLELNNYLEKLGISLLSAEIIVEDSQEQRISLPTEIHTPTLGVTNPRFQGEKPILVGFKVEDSGAERMRVVSEKLTARGFVHGEKMTDPQTITNPWRRAEESIIIPRTEMIGIGVSSVDHCKALHDLKTPYAQLICDERNQDAGVYFCQFLTHKAAARVLGLTLS